MTIKIQSQNCDVQKTCYRNIFLEDERQGISSERNSFYFRILSSYYLTSPSGRFLNCCSEIRELSPQLIYFAISCERNRAF